MAEQYPQCPGCGGEPFVDQPEDEPRYLECNECTFRARDRDWLRRTPGPATKAMLSGALNLLSFQRSRDVTTELTPVLQAFIAEWDQEVPE